MSSSSSSAPTTSDATPAVQNQKLFSDSIKLVVFDLDATLWETEMYLIDGPPFKSTDLPHVLTDRCGNRVELMSGSLAALRAFATDPRWAGVKVGVASRTDYPEWARKCIDMLKVVASEDADDSATLLSLKDLLHHLEIYESEKDKHLRALHKATGIAFEQMAFFDNEFRNIKRVSTLGVKCFYTPDGMTVAEYEKFVQSIEHGQE